jgi:hypothetical protein
MSYSEDYNMKIEVLKTITDDQIKVPNSIPLGIYIQEAENLYRWCQDDKEELKAKGLDWTVVEDLPVRCGALSVAESNWQSKQSQRRASEKIWLKEAAKGNDLRKELIHHFNYAFRNKSSLIEKVKEIANSFSFDDMIDGLYDLNVLGLVNQELLIKIGFDLTLLDLAAQKSRELAAKKESASFYSEDYLEVKKIRDQAFTHLKEAVDLIYDYGRYVFWKDSARLKGYSSNHMRNSKRKRARKTENAVPGTETGSEALKIKT